MPCYSNQVVIKNWVLVLGTVFAVIKCRCSMYVESDTGNTVPA